jgi:hypothetical protein
MSVSDISPRDDLVTILEDVTTVTIVKPKDITLPSSKEVIKDYVCIPVRVILNKDRTVTATLLGIGINYYGQFYGDPHFTSHITHSVKFYDGDYTKLYVYFWSSNSESGRHTTENVTMVSDHTRTYKLICKSIDYDETYKRDYSLIPAYYSHMLSEIRERTRIDNKFLQAKCETYISQLKVEKELDKIKKIISELQQGPAC